MSQLSIDVCPGDKWIAVQDDICNENKIHTVKSLYNTSRYNADLDITQLQSNLDYSNCKGPQESFRIIGSSNDRNQEFADIFGKAWMLSWNVIVLLKIAT